jgi:plastocyanin
MMVRAISGAVAALVLVAGPARAQPGGNLEQAVARLQKDVQELREMLIQAMRVEQEHHQLLLRLIQSGSGAPTPGGAVPEPSSGGGEPQPPRAAKVSGRVRVVGAPEGQPTFVFIEDLRAPPPHPASFELVQKGKQFDPQVSAVPVGTRASFPNRDLVFHNAFSLSRGNAFDLSLKAGERGPSVRLSRAGVVEVYCDIHAKMWAEILVTPSAHLARVAPDGTFILSDVPVGDRVVAAWTAGAPPVKRAVNLTAAGARIELSLKVGPRPAHNRKTGAPYGNYAE